MPDRVPVYCTEASILPATEVGEEQAIDMLGSNESEKDQVCCEVPVEDEGEADAARCGGERYYDRRPSCSDVW